MPVEPFLLRPQHGRKPTPILSPKEAAVMLAEAARRDAVVAVPERRGESPWLNVLEAARHIGIACPGGRAPNSIYGIANEIGSKVNGRWLIHRDALDRYVQSLAARGAAVR